MTKLAILARAVRDRLAERAEELRPVQATSPAARGVLPVTTQDHGQRGRTRAGGAGVSWRLESTPIWPDGKIVVSILGLSIDK
jgi:hypothetical protein